MCIYSVLEFVRIANIIDSPTKAILGTVVKRIKLYNELIANVI